VLGDRRALPCVRVQLPLDAVSNNNEVNEPEVLKQNLLQLANIGVEGVMGDVWWGIVESAPGQYNFSAYLQIVSIVAGAGLKYQVRAQRRRGCVPVAVCAVLSRTVSHYWCACGWSRRCAARDVVPPVWRQRR
jgi:hypothetical protein